MEAQRRRVPKHGRRVPVEAGGTLYVWVWDPNARGGKGSMIRRSLKPKNKDAAKRYAREQQVKLEQGAAEVPQPKLSLGRLFKLYFRGGGPPGLRAPRRALDRGPRQGKGPPLHPAGPVGWARLGSAVRGYRPRGQACPGGPAPSRRREDRGARLRVAPLGLPLGYGLEDGARPLPDEGGPDQVATWDHYEALSDVADQVIVQTGSKDGEPVYERSRFGELLYLVVAKAGGWATTAMVTEIYSQADDVTTLQVVLHEGRVREVR